MRVIFVHRSVIYGGLTGLKGPSMRCHGSGICANANRFC